MTRFDDGSAGDADYGSIGHGYAHIRQPDPRIEAIVWTALGDARTVLNVGAGAGSYEPRDREVTAVEPSASMRAERPPTGCAPSTPPPTPCRSTTTASTRPWRASPCTSGPTSSAASARCAGSHADRS